MRLINKISETIANLTSRTWRADFWELCDAHPVDYAFELADCTARSLVDRTERALYPAIAIHRGSPSPEQRRKRLYDLSPELKKAMESWVGGYIFFVGVNAQMLPDVHYLRFLGGFIPSVIIAVALVMHRQSLGVSAAGTEPVKLEPITPEGIIRKLKRSKDALFLGDFSPSKFWLRSGSVALAVLLMFFSLGFVMLRWSIGDALPSGVTKIDLLWRLVVGIGLFGLFLCAKKSSKQAADAYQKEIDELTTPVSD